MPQTAGRSVTAGFSSARTESPLMLTFRALIRSRSGFLTGAGWKWNCSKEA